jgi:short-chain fatty acids transporter
VLDFGKTSFTWQSMLSLVILIFAFCSAPCGRSIRSAPQMDVDRADDPESAGKPEHPVSTGLRTPTTPNPQASRSTPLPFK